jgi:hypothetical protein
VKPQTQANHWWDPVPVDTGATAILTLGPLIVQLHRGNDEWLVGWEREGAGAEPVRASMLRTQNNFQADNYHRYVSCSACGVVSVMPMLADRPVVVRPRQPVFILPGEDTTLYISSPVWVRIEVGDPPQALQEISVLRLSDSWFGPSTREGELCYAAPTQARKILAEVLKRPHRAVTPVRIHNRAANHLPIEKLSLPVPLLSTYGDDFGNLWTESVSLTRTPASDMAALVIAPGAPRDAPGAKLLTGPRELAERGGLVRAFSGLFG